MPWWIRGAFMLGAGFSHFIANDPGAVVFLLLLGIFTEICLRPVTRVQVNPVIVQERDFD